MLFLFILRPNLCFACKIIFMGFFKRNSRLLIIIIAFVFSFFSFFSIYLTGSYNHLKDLEAGLSKAREDKELVLTQKVVGLNEKVEDPLQDFKKEKNLSEKTIKELDYKIKPAQVVYQNSFVTVLTQLMLGLDLVGGAQLTFQAIPASGTEINNETILGLIKVFENRVNASGTAEAIIQQVGK